MADAAWMMDLIGTEETAQLETPEVSFSLREAAELLQVPCSLLRTLMTVPGLCAAWEHSGRISETTVRLLYAKLHDGS